MRNSAIFTFGIKTDKLPDLHISHIAQNTVPT